MSFFFTMLDDSLRPKGSRDPLGLEHIWSQTGRWLVGNLTTVTGNLDNFIVALIGFHLCAEKENAPQWPKFQRYEQVMARARVRLGGRLAAAVLGSRQVARAPDANPVFLGSSRQAGILSSQRQSGLWGMYSSALCATGLTNRDRGTTERGAEMAKSFLNQLPKAQRDWLTGTLGKGQIPLEELNNFQSHLSGMLNADQPRRQLLGYLLNGRADSQAGTPQVELHLQATRYLELGNPADNLRSFFGFLQDNSAQLGDYAVRIEQMESVLIVASRVFDFLLGKHGAEITELVTTLEKLEKWPGRTSLGMPTFPELCNGPWQRRVATLDSFAGAVRENCWELALRALLEHHASVMKARSGTAWAFEESGRLKVIFGSPAKGLPTDRELAEEVADWWDNSYFVGSFLALLGQAAKPEVAS